MADDEQLSLLITGQTLASDGFGSPPKFRALIADFDGEPAGYAFFFDSYSTFQGRGLFLEDLFVRPQFRKNKVGLALLSRVAAIAQLENCLLRGQCSEACRKIWGIAVRSIMLSVTAMEEAP